MLKDRLMVGILGGIFAIFILAFGNEILISLIISIIALVALAEIYNVLGFFKKNFFLVFWGYLLSITVLYLASAGSLYSYFSELLYIYILVLLVYMVIAHKKTTFTDVANNLFSTMYVVLFFAYLILIRKNDNGKLYIWIPFIVAWLSDTMAYTFGRLFGKHKLIPAVSPKKTIEGAIGGIFGGVVFMIFYALVCKYFCDVDIKWISIIALGIFGSALSQFGDLSASRIKREYGVKDYGNLFPGHGGVIDRFDSVIAIAPFIYYYIEIFPIF